MGFGENWKLIYEAWKGPKDPFLEPKEKLPA